MTSPYYSPDGDPISMDEWAAYQLTGADRVALTRLGNVEVSTVWLGLDHNFGLSGPPLIFESMVFGGQLDETQWRYPNRHAALAGHDQLVAEVRDAELHHIAIEIKHDFGFGA